MRMRAFAAIRTEPARACPGVLAVLTAADYAADGHKGIAQFANTADAVEPQKPAFGDSPDHFVFEHPQAVLAGERVRYVGEPVALIVAQTLDQARDAAEAVEVEYEMLPAVVSIEDALEPFGTAIVGRRAGQCQPAGALRKCRGGRAQLRGGRAGDRARPAQSTDRQLPDGAARRQRALRSGRRIATP